MTNGVWQSKSFRSHRNWFSEADEAAKDCNPRRIEVPDMPSGPIFEPDEGNCEVPNCANLADYRALWPGFSKLVCETHRKHVTDKPWAEVSILFESVPPR
jgi:hypothetical protein